jgi:glutathione synthase/RimK-type ligase-like ATP-grasp enzyme
MTQLRIGTCRTLPEVDADEAPLAEALAAGGFDATLCAWDDPSVDWDAPVPTILRSTWNYALDVAGFLAWIERVSAVAPLWNPPDIVRGNVHKRYLLELARRGVPVVPTVIAETAHDVAAIARELSATRIVIKPEVGAGSLGTRVFDIATERDAATAHLVGLTSRGLALVQPYMHSVDGYGERSLVWIDGALSHEIRKTARFAGDVERIDGPFPIADDERAVAEAALAPLVDRLLYARVDLARDDKGQPMVMELELVEPSLFFARQPGSAARYVAGLHRRLLG